MLTLSQDVKSQYRTWIVLTWFAAIAATVLLALFISLGYRWIFRPLRILVKGSRRVAGGDFDYRIQLPPHDEMAELADAMNDMTARFQAIRDDLDRQVQVRTKQVVRSEQLASVGFLAAGVAHEINNPLASIAMCAESLESRLLEIGTGLTAMTAEVDRPLSANDPDRGLPLQGNHREAARFLPHGRRQAAERRSARAGAGVIDMVRPPGQVSEQQHRVRRRRAGYRAGQPAGNQAGRAEPDHQRARQPRCRRHARRSNWCAKPNFAEMIFTDNGCGMTDEVLEHLFEPFFTRTRRAGHRAGPVDHLSHRRRPRRAHRSHQRRARPRLAIPRHAAAGGSKMRNRMQTSSRRRTAIATKPHKRLKLLFADDERSLQELMSLELTAWGTR